LIFEEEINKHFPGPDEIGGEDGERNKAYFVNQIMKRSCFQLDASLQATIRLKEVSSKTNSKNRNQCI
jgi:hypothetical protein